MAKALIEETSLEIMNKCKAQGDLTDVRLEWEYVQEFRRNHPFLHWDQRGKKIIRLMDGVRIPGTQYQVNGMINAPIDPHIITLSNGIEAKIAANYPFLVPQVRAATSEDSDRDAAKNSTLLLMHYRERFEEEIYKEITGNLLPSGNAYIKTYWDKNAGEYGAMNEQGVPVKVGDIAVEVVPPQKMLVPKGIGKNKNLPWIGEQKAIPVETIADLWGKEVPAEDDLEDINTLQSIDYNGNLRHEKLEGHARVFEIYIRPNARLGYPNGRLIIRTAKTELFNGEWDSKLTSKYPDEWHPYTHIKWVNIEGDYWGKSGLFYVVDHQKQLNKLYAILTNSKKYTNGMWISPENAVDWKKIKQNSDQGILKVEHKLGMQPQFVPAPTQNLNIIGEMQTIRQWMNDIMANYEVSRGNNSPGITSGKQTQMLQAANNQNNSPLLSNIACAFTKGHWLKELRLCAVHFEDAGRLIRITGESNESIAQTFAPDQINSDDIILAYGPCFLLDPQSRNQELDRMFPQGFFGNPQDPVAQKRYTKLRGIGGGLEEVYSEFEADEKMQEIENKKFEVGDWYEKDQVLINQHPLMQPIFAWQQAKQVFDGAAQALMSGQITEKQMEEVGAPPDPGLEPPMPKIYLMARSYEDHVMHLKTLNRFRKSSKFENMCLANPELRTATDFHEQSHMGFLNPPILPGMGGQNIPGGPPAGMSGPVGPVGVQ